MKNLLLCAAFTASAFLLSSVASAATVIITEGNRGLVAGSTTYSPIDAPGVEPGYHLDTIGLNEDVDTIELHGRVVTDTDYFHFTATSSFTVEWIFDGYDLEAGGGSTVSGLVGENSQNDPVNFTIAKNPNGGVPELSLSLLSNITSGESLLFSGTAGDYILSFGGLENPVLYDVRVSTVPLPAALPLMAAGMAIMSYFGWRRKKAATA